MDDVDTMANTGELSANWDQAVCAYDYESGITRVEYAIGTTKGGSEYHAWTDTTFSTYVYLSPVTLTIGTSYYFNLRAINNAGLISGTTASDGVRIEVSSSPTILTLTDTGIWQRNNNGLYAVWTATIPAGATITGYEYAIGTGPTREQITSLVNWKPGTLI
jgi:hypothetical protein